ncbi:MAG: metal-dependent hydrolase [Pseudomonadales bacterium]|nr:metal-dependent hydrolase [Pseudomonadales bacterium]
MSTIDNINLSSSPNPVVVPINKSAQLKATNRTRPGVEILPRKPKFGPFDKINKYWAMGNPAVSFGQSFFSLVIPEGEKFFIRTVNAVRDQITDPELLEDVKAFAKQEGVHAKYHDDFNAHLVKYGFDADAITRDANQLFTFSEKIFTKKAALAITAFAEHITAMGAAMEFRFPEFTEDSDPKAVEFWHWHAAEEMEHKSVAFDVFKEVGGSYFTRVGAIVGFGAISSVFFPRLVLRELKGFKNHQSSEVPIPLSRIARKYPGINMRMAKFGSWYFMQYFKPNFHPWNIDNSHYIDEWKSENPNVNYA